MHCITLPDTLLTANDISSILNLICPSCGGPLGEPSKEFKCQGLCRKDWRPDWEGSITARMLNKAQSRRRTPKNSQRRISSRHHPWRGPGEPTVAK